MTLALALLCAMTVGAEPQLGTPLRRDGYTLRPPVDFKMARSHLFEGTQTGAISVEPGQTGVASAALVDGEGEDAATLLVSVVDGSFAATPRERDDFSTASVMHFAEKLNLTLNIQKADVVASRTPRVEVVGLLRHDGRLRYVRIAAMEGRGRHVVLMFSAPAGRWESLQPAFTASLDSFSTDAPMTGPMTRSLAGAAAGALAGGLFVSMAVWRRRRRRRREHAF